MTAFVQEVAAINLHGVLRPLVLTGGYGPLPLARGSLAKEQSNLRWLRRHQAGDGVTDSVRSATGHGGECDA